MGKLKGTTHSYNKMNLFKIKQFENAHCIGGYVRSNSRLNEKTKQNIQKETKIKIYKISMMFAVYIFIRIDKCVAICVPPLEYDLASNLLQNTTLQAPVNTLLRWCQFRPDFYIPEPSHCTKHCSMRTYCLAFVVQGSTCSLCLSTGQTTTDANNANLADRISMKMEAVQSEIYYL